MAFAAWVARLRSRSPLGPPARRTGVTVCLWHSAAFVATASPSSSWTPGCSSGRATQRKMKTWRMRKWRNPSGSFVFPRSDETRSPERSPLPSIVRRPAPPPPSISLPLVPRVSRVPSPVLSLSFSSCFLFLARSLGSSPSVSTPRVLYPAPLVVMLPAPSVVPCNRTSELTPALPSRSPSPSTHHSAQVQAQPQELHILTNTATLAPLHRPHILGSTNTTAWQTKHLPPIAGVQESQAGGAEGGEVASQT